MTDTEPQVEYSERYLSQIAYSNYLVQALGKKYGSETDSEMIKSNLGQFATEHNLKPEQAVLAYVYATHLLHEPKYLTLPGPFQIQVTVLARRLTQKANQDHQIAKILEIMTLFALVNLPQEYFPQINPEDDV